MQAGDFLKVSKVAHCDGVTGAEGEAKDKGGIREVTVQKGQWRFSRPLITQPPAPWRSPLPNLG